MNEKIKVNLDFINKKGELKHVKFYMDKQSYDMIFDVSISDEIRNKYLIDEYHEYERRKYQNRKIVSIDNKIFKLDNLIDNSYISNEDKYYASNKIKKLKQAINKLTPRQKEMLRLIYWEGKKQKELCEIYGVKKQAISDAVKRMHNRLKKNLKK